MTKPLIRKYNASNQVWFVAVGDGLDRINRGGSISFRTYTDHNDALGKGAGQVVQYVASKDNTGKEIGRWFVLDESRRRLQVRMGETDMNGISQYDFLKNSPDCEGSPNGTYQEIDGQIIQQGVCFREFNTNKDAEVALEAESQRLQAQASAIGLDDQTLQEIAANIDVFGPADMTMKLKVLEFAGKRPVDYFKVFHAGDRSVRATIRKAVAEGVLSKKGEVLYWSDTLIGGDENQAVTTLLNDPTMMDALKAKVNLDTTIKVPEKPKNPGGRPRKNSAPVVSPPPTSLPPATTL